MNRLLLLSAVFILVAPGTIFAASGFEISAWIPYWKSNAGVESISPNISTFTEVNPFIYTVKEDGTLNQASKLSSEEWVNLKENARAHNVRFIPTITWAGSDSIDRILGDSDLRASHIKSIASEVYLNNLDGIDIDYEAKYARTRESFSLFLKELEEAIGYDKWVMCTIEARTPLESRYSSIESIPNDIEYSNDFKEINKYCDRVRIMAYDQGRYDLKLNESNSHPYIPVADVAWVEKVMRLAMEDISPDKLTIGVATYGYEYDMFVDSNGKTQYSRLWSFNPRYPDETIAKLGISPYRNSAGEMTLTYPASQSVDPIIPLPNATRVMSWSDSGAILQKIDLAKRLGLRGVSVFKIDGGQDANVFATLSPNATAHYGVKPEVGGTSLGSVGGPASKNNISISIPSRDLQIGSTGEDVRNLQKYLNENGYVVATAGPGSVGNETTKFGALTRAALIKFQKANNINPAVGYFGPITRAKMSTLAIR